MLKREASQQDDLNRAQRAVLARTEPKACLDRLAADGKALLDEIRRLLEAQAEWEAGFVIIRRLRSRRWPTATERVIQGATMGRARKRLQRALEWTRNQHSQLKAEADTVLARCTAIANARIFKLKRRLFSNRIKADEVGLLVGGRAVPQRGANPILSDVRDKQLEVIRLEKWVRELSLTVYQHFGRFEGLDRLTLLRPGDASLTGDMTSNIKALNKMSRTVQARETSPSRSFSFLTTAMSEDSLAPNSYARCAPQTLSWISHLLTTRHC